VKIKINMSELGTSRQTMSSFHSELNPTVILKTTSQQSLSVITKRKFERITMFAAALSSSMWFREARMKFVISGTFILAGLAYYNSQVHRLMLWPQILSIPKAMAVARGPSSLHTRSTPKLQSEMMSRWRQAFARAMAHI
jgi:hypothetical protein